MVVKNVKTTVIIVLFLVMSLGVSSQAALYLWDTNEVTSPGFDWHDVNNWFQDWVKATRLPKITDNIYNVDWTYTENYPVISHPNALCDIMFVGSNTSSPTWKYGGGFIVEPGGELTANRIDINIWGNKNVRCTVNGGYVETPELHMNFNWQAWGYLNPFEGARILMFGGELKVLTTLGINANSNDPCAFSNGEIHVFDGLLTHEWHDPCYINLEHPGAIVINYGAFRIRGDHTASGSGMISYLTDVKGWVVAAPGGTLTWEYNGAYPGYTTITNTNPVPFYCLENPADDLDGDCLVGWSDLESITSNWLAPYDFVGYSGFADGWGDCGYIPNSQCP